MSTSARSSTTSAHAVSNKKAPAARCSPGACWPRDWNQWLPLIVLSCVVTLNLVGLLLVVRRFGGALREPFPTRHMFLTALFTTALVAYSRTAWRRARLAYNTQKKQADLGHNPWSQLDRWVGWGSSLGLILLAVGCTYPADRVVDWLAWLPLLVADQFWRQSFFDGGKPIAPISGDANGIRNAEMPATPLCADVITPPAANPPAASRTGPFNPLSSSKPRDIVPLSDNLSDSLPSDHDEQLLQQLFRVRNAAGQETIYGTLRADFERGQRNASLYVGFCPPLARPPQVEAEPVDGPAATLKVVQALAHGARVDIRLDRPADGECHVLVDMAALDSGLAGESAPSPNDISRQACQAAPPAKRRTG